VYYPSHCDLIEKSAKPVSKPVKGDDYE